MNRRTFFSAAPAALAAGVVAPFVQEASAAGPASSGVGVLRFPIGKKESARKLCGEMYPGCVICLPNTRDAHGDYEWDFRIEGGDPAQVQVERPTEQA